MIPIATGIAERTIRKALILGAVLGLSAIATPGVAQEYPARSIRLVVPNPPGGPADWLGRAVAAQLEKRLGKPVVVENRTGAGSYTGTEFVSRAEPDGYTLLLSGNTMA